MTTSNPHRVPDPSGLLTLMRPFRPTVLVSFLLILNLFLRTAGAQEKSPSLVITHASIVDTHGGQLLRNMTVVIHGDRIAKIAKSEPISAQAGTTFDASGKFLIPGLWDMEVHLSWTTNSALPALVANGITGVRDMGGRTLELEEWRSRIEAGVLIGPTIVQTGPMLNGKSFNPYQMVIGPPEEARAVVRTLKTVGVQGLSLERKVPRDSYFALMDEAKRQGLPVGGHIPNTVRPEEASDAGQNTIENAETIFDGTFGEGINDAELPDAVERFLASGNANVLFERFVKNHNVLTPALSTYKSAVKALDSSAPPDPNLRYVAASLRKDLQKNQLSPDVADVMKRLYPPLFKAVQQMHRNGVTFLAGTDIAGPRIPGFSLHDELALLVQTGLTPLQALQTATLNPATVLKKVSEYGAVEEGKIADLVLLDANPLENIENTRRISAVILQGRLFRRDQLNMLLREAEKLADQN
jgi:imidazolonepropionase-like amidohydrolase